MTTAKQARHSQFQRGSGVFPCQSCGHNTRDTGDNGQCKLCPICYELAGLDNARQDNQLTDRDLVSTRAYLSELIGQSGEEAAKKAFPELYNLCYVERPAGPTQAAPAEQDGVGSGGTGEEAATDEEGPGGYFVFVKGIEDDPDYVMIVDSTSSYQARRVAKRLVAKQRSLDGLTFSARKA